MTVAAPSPPRPRRSWLLIVSLCINIALIPVIAAVVIRAAHRDVQIGSGGVLAPRTLMSAFPLEAGRIQKAIDAHTSKIKALRHDAVEARRGAYGIFAAGDYTPQKMAATLGAIHAADSALEAESLAMMNDSLSALSPGERLALAERIKKRNRSWLFRLFRPKMD